MILKLLLVRDSKHKDNEKVNCIKIIKREYLLEKIRSFKRQSSNFELIFVGLVEGKVESLSLPEKFAIWQKIGEIIDEAKKMGLKVLKHGISGDGRIFLVIAK